MQEYHTTGLAWNTKVTSVSTIFSSQILIFLSTSQGVNVKDFTAKSGAGASASAPPPPPPPPPVTTAPATSTGSAANPTAVFAELNKGEEVTKGLRKVDKSEMTHKNPSLRASGTVSNSTSPTTPPSTKRPLVPKKPAALAVKKQPKFALEGNKWNIVSALKYTRRSLEMG